MHDATLERTTNGRGWARRAAMATSWSCCRSWTPAAGIRAATPANRCPRWRPSRASAGATTLPEHRDQAHARHRAPHRRGGGPRCGAPVAGRAVPPLLSSFRPEALHGARSRGAAAAARPVAGHAVDGWLDMRASWAAWPSSATTRCGIGPRGPGQGRRPALPELHRQRRMGGAAPDRPGHRWHHHRPGRPVSTCLTGITSGRPPATPAFPPGSRRAPDSCGGRNRA